MCIFIYDMSLTAHVYRRAATRCFCVAFETKSTHRDHASVGGVWASHFWFPTNNFQRDVLISFKVYRRLKLHKIQVKKLVSIIRKYHNYTPQTNPRHRQEESQKLEKGGHPQNFGRVMAVLLLRQKCTDYVACATLHHDGSI